MKRKLKYIIISMFFSIFMMNTNAQELNSNKITPFNSEKDMCKKGDEKDLFLYNLYIKNNHSAMQADNEGGMALKGTSYIPKGGAFNYGGFFDNPNIGAGSPLTPRHKVALVIGNEIKIAKDSKQVVVGKGHALINNKSHEWVNQNKLMFNGSIKSLPKSDLDTLFKSLDSQLDNVENRVKHLSNTTKVYADDKYYVQSVNNQRWFVRQSSEDSKILVVDIKTDGNSVVMPQVSGLDKLIDDPAIKQIIMTSNAQHVSIKDSVQYHHQTIASYNPLAKDIAKKVVYYLPNAVEVSNLTIKGTQATNISKKINLNKPVDDSGKDLLSNEFLQNYHTHGTDLLGTLLAPKSSTIWSGGSINGYVWTNNFHQRNGAEAHNFYNPWLTDKPQKKGSIEIVKYDDKDHEKLLAGAEFKVLNKDDEKVGQIVTDKTGHGMLSNLPFGDYVVIETKAPEGYVLDDTPRPVRVVEGKESNVVTVEIENVAFAPPVTPELPGKGTIEVIKYDDKDHEKLLAGAEFKVLNKDDEEIDQIVTDETGHGFLSGLSFGDYTIIETKAPEGYVLDDTPHPVKVVEGKETNMVTIKIENTSFAPPVTPELPGKGTIEVIKYDRDDHRHVLAGAEFEVLNKDDKEVGQIVTDETGHGFLSDLSFGDYTVIETKAPEGYVLDNTPHPVKVVEGKETNMVSIEIENTAFALPVTPTLPGKGIIEVIKYDRDDHRHVLAGAEFKVLNKDDEKVGQIVTDKTGHGMLSNLPFGDYVVIETKAPEGYVLDDTPRPVRVVEGKESNVVTVEIENVAFAPPVIPELPGKGAVEVIKYDDKDHEKLLAGAEFKVLNKDDEEVGQIVTDETGHGMLSNLPFGDYVVIETKAPEGYELDETPHPVTVKEGKETNVVTIEIKNTAFAPPVIPELPGKGAVEVIKCDDKDHEKLLAGAEFKVLNKDDEEVGQIVTDETGHGILSNLPFGDYVVIETKAPEGYVLDDTPRPVKVVEGKESNVVTIKIENTAFAPPVTPEVPGKGTIRVIKYDDKDHEKLLAGAEFKVLNKDDEEVGQIVTDKTGHGMLSNLNFGDYVVIETKAPEGYVLDDTPRPVKVVEGKETNVVTIEIENIAFAPPVTPELPGKGAIEVIKYDDKDHEKLLAGAEFKVLNKDDEEVGQIVTDKTGHGMLSDLNFGDYVVIETKAPEGYVLDNTPRPIKVVEGKESNVVTIKIENTAFAPPVIPELPGKGAVEVIKYDDKDHEKLLAGAEFKVLNKDDEEVGQIVTDETGHGMLSNLNFGDYVVIETKAPEGYVLDDTPRPVKVVEGKETNVVTIKIGNTILIPPMKPEPEPEPKPEPKPEQKPEKKPEQKPQINIHSKPINKIEKSKVLPQTNEHNKNIIYIISGLMVIGIVVYSLKLKKEK